MIMIIACTASTHCAAAVMVLLDDVEPRVILLVLLLAVHARQPCSLVSLKLFEKFLAVTAHLGRRARAYFRGDRLVVMRAVDLDRVQETLVLLFCPVARLWRP